MKAISDDLLHEGSFSAQTRDGRFRACTNQGIEALKESRFHEQCRDVERAREQAFYLQVSLDEHRTPLIDSRVRPLEPEKKGDTWVGSVGDDDR